MKLLKPVLSIIFLFLFLYVSAAWYFSTTVLHLPIRECNQEHYVFCETPAEQGITYEEITYSSTDGLTLPGWFMPSATDLKTVLFVHGRGASRREGMRYAKPLIAAGYNVVAIDMRHPRQGEGIISTMSFYERNDVIGAVNYIKDRFPNTSVGVMGFSMGASTSIIAMAHDDRIKAGIFNGGFANATDVLADNVHRMYGLPYYPIMPAAMAFVALRSGADTDDINPEAYIASIAPRPVFIMHGTADTTVEFYHGERLFNAANEPKTFWALEGAGHTRLWQADQETAVKKVVSFFNDTL